MDLYCESNFVKFYGTCDDGGDYYVVSFLLSY